ncbi:hypothetical protein F506_04695 [Herbaspirillum hiltneri N3]|uniref:Uncharacterized protein n=1 Tax=Herbaspirillum hiltneri N3 TaxID=1262470 RepID=A0ABM5UXY3_9BURK|nr:hypothetical protein F506_04695 [Herbaspirillum hiltneri N3]
MCAAPKVGTGIQASKLANKDGMWGLLILEIEVTLAFILGINTQTRVANFGYYLASIIKQCIFLLFLF